MLTVLIRSIRTSASGKLNCAVCWACCCGWLLSCLAAPGVAQQLHRASSITPLAELQTITPTGWQFSKIDQPIARSQVVRWGSWPGILKQQAVWLNDGSWLVGEIELGGGSTLKIDSDWLDIPAIELSTVRGIVVNPPASFSRWVELQRQMMAADGGQDVVWLLNRQRVAGVIRWPSDASNAEQFTLDAQAQITSIDFSSVAAIVFSPTLAGPLPAAAGHTLGLSDGTLLRLNSLDVAGEGAVSMQLMSNLRVDSLDPPAGFANAVRYIAEAVPGVTYLSDLQPANYRNATETKLNWELGRDVDVQRRPLNLNHGIVSKGLALHSSSQVAYRWDGSPARLLSQVVLAPPHPQSLETLGSVVCQVLVARGGKLETVKEFKLSRSTVGSAAEQANQPVQSSPIGELVDIDLTGAKLVVLIVEKGDYGQYGDQVFWLDARIK